MSLSGSSNGLKVRGHDAAPTHPTPKKTRLVAEPARAGDRRQPLDGLQMGIWPASNPADGGKTSLSVTSPNQSMDKFRASMLTFGRDLIFHALTVFFMAVGFPISTGHFDLSEITCGPCQSDDSYIFISVFQLETIRLPSNCQNGSRIPLFLASPVADFPFIQHDLKRS